MKTTDYNTIDTISLLARLVSVIEQDLQYVKRMIAAGFVHSPVLEVGAGYQGENCKSLLTGSGLEYAGTDIVDGPDVTYVADLAESFESVSKIIPPKNFKTILCMNVLEHVFDPIRVLDNCIGLLPSGGTCLFIAPSLWPLHNFPMDVWRINPNFCEEYCKRRSLILQKETFEYIGYHSVYDTMKSPGEHTYPVPYKSKFHELYSRIVHKVFGTSGRAMFFPSFVCIGVVIQVP